MAVVLRWTTTTTKKKVGGNLRRNSENWMVKKKKNCRNGKWNQTPQATIDKVCADCIYACLDRLCCMEKMCKNVDCFKKRFQLERSRFSFSKTIFNCTFKTLKFVFLCNKSFRREFSTRLNCSHDFAHKIVFGSYFTWVELHLHQSCVHGEQFTARTTHSHECNLCMCTASAKCNSKERKYIGNLVGKFVIFFYISNNQMENELKSI